MNADELPGAADLLRTAREVLLRELLPLLPEARRYDGLLIASAIAIAQRTLERPSSGEPIDAVALAAEIRSGRHDDGPSRADVAAALKARVEAVLAVNNPKAV